jgi:hypothetical protein
MIRRNEASRARTDTRAWAVNRRVRTRQLIELGGLVQKAGLIDLADDDRATLLGGFIVFAELLAGDRRQAVLAVCQRRGRRAFARDHADPEET